MGIQLPDLPIFQHAPPERRQQPFNVVKQQGGPKEFSISLFNQYSAESVRVHFELEAERPLEPYLDIALFEKHRCEDVSGGRPDGRFHVSGPALPHHIPGQVQRSPGTGRKRGLSCELSFHQRLGATLQLPR